LTAEGIAGLGRRKTDISIFGQESNPTTWRLAHMNLAIRGIEANLGSQPTGNANYAWIQHFIHHLAPPNGHGGARWWMKSHHRRSPRPQR
jgi:type I restriction enzyme M protein